MGEISPTHSRGCECFIFPIRMVMSMRMGIIVATGPLVVSEIPKQSKTTSRLVVNKGSNSRQKVTSKKLFYGFRMISVLINSVLLSNI